MVKVVWGVEYLPLRFKENGEGIRRIMGMEGGVGGEWRKKKGGERN